MQLSVHVSIQNQNNMYYIIFTMLHNAFMYAFTNTIISLNVTGDM